MNTKLDNRAKLTKIIKRMSEHETQQMLAFTAGLDIGKKLHGKSLYYPEQPHKITQ